MEQRILNLLGQKDYVPLTAENLQRHLRLSHRPAEEFLTTLHKLEQTGQIVRIKNGRYIRPREADLIPGRIRINRQGKGFLAAGRRRSQGNHRSRRRHRHRVARRPRAGAARCAAKSLRAGAETPETGVVIRILERKRTQIVGTLQRGRQFLYVIPDDPRMPHDIYVPPPRDVGRPAHVGDKVVVELREWESRNTNPEGEIIEVLGAPDEEGVDMLSVLRQYELPLHFPQDVLQRRAPSARRSSRSDLAGREDCRRAAVVTIDPDDAKDFDDAICLQRGREPAWKLWVHIADVSHYVKPGTRAGRGSAQTRQLDLPRGPRHPDAAGGVEQRTLFAETERGPPDQVRGVSDRRTTAGCSAPNFIRR